MTGSDGKEKVKQFLQWYRQPSYLGLTDLGPVATKAEKGETTTKTRSKRKNLKITKNKTKTNPAG